MTPHDPPRPLHIPPFYCPFPDVNHVDLDAIDRRSIDWLRGFGVFPGDAGLRLLQRWHLPEFAARAYPEDDPERVQWMADFVHWTIFDDSLVDGDRSHVAETAASGPGGFAAIANKLVRMLEAPEARLLPDDPWISSLMDLRRRLGALATPQQAQRWVGAFREYLLASAWRRAYQHSARLPNLADYVLMRTPDGGIELYVTASEVIGHYALADAELAHPRIRALTEMALTIIAWDNDIFSHYKESLHEDPCVNLLDILAADRGCSLQDAVHLAMAMRDRVMTRYLQVRDHALPRHAEPTRRYVTSLDRWIASNIDVSAISERYINPLARPADEVPWIRFDAVRTDRPCDDTPGSLPFASIAGWWRRELHAA